MVLQSMYRTPSIALTGRDQAKGMERVAGYWEWRMTEAIKIGKTTPNVNLDSDLLLPMVWNPILNPPQPTTSQSRSNR